MADATIPFPEDPDFVQKLKDVSGGTGAAHARAVVLVDANGTLINPSTVTANMGTGTAAVAGNAASGAADLGNPVKIGGVYNSSAPVFTTGQRGDLQLDAAGNLRVSQATLIAGEDLTNNLLKVEQRFSYTYISTATTTVVKASAGFLHSIVVNGGTAGTIIVYDNPSTSGTIIASFDSTNALATYTFNSVFATGLTIITGSATKLTVNWR